MLGVMLGASETALRGANLDIVFREGFMGFEPGRRTGVLYLTTSSVSDCATRLVFSLVITTIASSMPLPLPSVTCPSILAINLRGARIDSSDGSHGTGA